MASRRGPKRELMLAPAASALASALQGSDIVDAGDGVVLRFHDAWPHEDAAFLRRATMGAWRRLVRDFGELPSVTVVGYAQARKLRESRSFMGREAPANGVVGCHDPHDGHVRVSRDASPGWQARLVALLMHELTHHAVRALSCGRAPAFVDEGLAMHRSQLPSDRQLATLAAARASGRLRTFEALCAPPTDVASLEGHAAADLADAQAQAIGWLVAREPHGRERTRRLLEALAGSPGGADGFRQAMASEDPEGLALLAGRTAYDEFVEDAMRVKSWYRMLIDWLDPGHEDGPGVRASRMLAGILRAAEKDALQLVDGRVLFDRYTVMLSPGDHASLGPGLVQLIEAELATRLEKRAKERGDRLAGPAKVEIVTDRSVAPGEVDVKARLHGRVVPIPSRMPPAAAPGSTGRKSAAPRPANVPPPFPRSQAAPAEPPKRERPSARKRSDAPTRLVPDTILKLRVTPGHVPQDIVELSPGPWSFGRGSTADVFLGEDDRLSRIHFVLEVGKDGSALLIDKSRNGTLVDGQRVEGRRPLTAGSRIAVAGIELEVVRA